MKQVPSLSVVSLEVHNVQLLGWVTLKYMQILQIKPHSKMLIEYVGESLGRNRMWLPLLSTNKHKHKGFYLLTCNVHLYQ